MIIGVVVCGVVLWFGQAFGLSRVMDWRGFHPRPWFVVPLLIGPVCWPVALIKAFSGPPIPEVVRWGSRGRGPLHVFELFVVLERDELPAPISTQITRLMPYCDRLVFARVTKADGPAAIKSSAETFLHRVVRNVGSEDVELQIMFGHMRQAVQSIHEKSVFTLVLRSDQPDELFDGDGGMRRKTCPRDAMSA